MIVSLIFNPEYGELRRSIHKCMETIRKTAFMGSRTMQFVILLLAMAGISLSEESASSWNQFRGPNGSGVEPSDWSPPIQIGPEVEAWRAPVPKGISSPVVGGNRIFITGVDGDQLVTLAFDRETGKLAWRRVAPGTASEEVHQSSSPAASTPLVLHDRVVVYFGSFGLLCYDFEGEELWKKPIPMPKSLYGVSTSPIAFEDSVILVLDSDRNLQNSEVSESKILAVDSSDGETIWETPRPFFRSGWSTPVIWRHDSGMDLVVLGHGKLNGYDPETGKGRWSVSGFSRETIAVPVIGNGVVFGSSSQLGGGGDVKKDPAPLWDALKPFDENGNGTIERAEMKGNFTFPFRPELPPGHPGFGMPLPNDPAKRKERIDWIVTWVDKNRDGVWTKEEFFQNLKGGRGKPLLVAVKPGGNGDVTETHVAWEMNRNIPEIPSPLFFDDRLFLVRKGGLLTALRAEDGESLYRVRIPDAPGQYAASPIVANQHLFLVSSLGLVSVVASGDEFKLVRQHDIGEAVDATPAVDENTIYFRTEFHLVAFRKK